MRMLLALPLHPRCRFSAHARRLNERLTKSLSTLPRGLGVDPNPVRPTSLDRRPAQLGAGGHAELCTTSCAQHCTGKARRLAGVFCPSWQGYAPSWDVLNATSGHDDRHESGSVSRGGGHIGSTSVLSPALFLSARPSSRNLRSPNGHGVCRFDAGARGSAQ